MNLPRLRELVQAGKDGALRPEEVKELFEALPEVLDKAARWERYSDAMAVERRDDVGRVQDDYAGRFGY